MSYGMPLFTGHTSGDFLMRELKAFACYAEICLGFFFKAGNSSLAPRAIPSLFDLIGFLSDLFAL